MNRLTLSPNYSLEVVAPGEITEELVDNIVTSFYEAQPYSSNELTHYEAREGLYSLVRNPSCVMIILQYNNKPVGHIVGQIVDNHPFLIADRIAFELSWWVHPEHRNNRYSLKLLDAYEEWAKIMDCTKIMTTAMNNEYSEVLDKLYKRKGYNLTEKSYIKEID